MNLPKTRKEWLETMRKAEAGEISESELSDSGVPVPEENNLARMSRYSIAASAYIHGGKSHDLLGHPKGRQYIRMDGAHQRDYENGSVVANVGFNNNVRVNFDKPMRRLRDSFVSNHFVVKSPGGDIFVNAEL